MEVEAKTQLIEMLEKMIKLIEDNKLEEIEPYVIALHGRVCHCREYSH